MTFGTSKLRGALFAGALLTAAAVALAACSRLGDPVVEPDPPPGNPLPGTTFIPQLPSRGDTTVREGELLQIRFFAPDPDSLGVVYRVEGPGAFSGADWAWRPDFSQAGSHSVRVIAHASGHPEWADTLTFTVVVIDEPQLGPRLGLVRDTTILENQLLALTLSADDPRNRGVAYSMTGPAGATLSGATFSWRPSFAQAGLHDVTFRVTENGASPRRDSLRVRVTVLDVDRPPVLQAVRDTAVDTSRTLQFTLSAVDPDGDLRVYSLANGAPQGASVTGSIFSWKPTAAQAGTHTLLLVVFANGLFDVDTVVVTVTLPPPIPIGPGDTTGLGGMPTPLAHWNFNEGAGNTLNDLGTGARHATLSGGTFVAGVQGTAISFNGSQYAQSTASFPDMAEQTLSAWVYLNALPGQACIITEANTDSGRDNRICIAASGRAFFEGRGNPGVLSSNTVLQTGRWYLITAAASATNSVIRMYINGQLDNTYTGEVILTGHHGRINIGRISDGGAVVTDYLNGRIDELKVYDKALTPEQVLIEWNRHKQAAGY